jgi:hypothetical protein
MTSQQVSECDAAIKSLSLQAKGRTIRVGVIAKPELTPEQRAKALSEWKPK